MSLVRYPDDWQDATSVVADIGAVLDRAELSWLQASIELGYVLAQILLAEEDDGIRLALADVLAAKLVEAARTGRLPGEMLQ